MDNRRSLPSSLLYCLWSVKPSGAVNAAPLRNILGWGLQSYLTESFRDFKQIILFKKIVQD